MEIAGLALGVVGVAGILSAFQDVAELYSLFVDSRNVGRDYEMLDTKLEIERTMLLHWADRVGLLRSDYDPRLDNPNTQETVFRLNDLLPATSGPSVAQSEPPPTQGFPGHPIGPEALTGQPGIGKRAIPNTAQDVVDQRCQDKILETLWFRTMEAREEEIKLAHAKTLNWALEPPDGTVEWDDLSEWLRSGEDIYWVSGKAGSGKSTLMKRLFHHPRTKELLTEWAKGDPVHLASFFFWNLGTPEQKTQEGLSRSLLHQILSRYPSLIREALPGMWKELNHTNDSVGLPSLSETRHAFRVIAAKAGDLGKFCFLIDGLDEFTGDYRNAISFIQELTANPGFKAVVSSRPIPECVDAFEDNPRLQLNQLTLHDIKTYVDDVIGGHKYMKKLMNRHPAKARLLMGTIVEKSSGVFFWVVIACRSLLSGFADYDRLEELQRRVVELPPELEDMFKLMLSKINKRHREQGAFTLRVCHSLSLPANSARPYFVSGMGALPLALLCREDADAEVLSEEEKEDLRDGLQGWLTSRCGGLLEARVDTRYSDTFLRYHVAWVHRSVVEFLSSDGAWELECLHIDEDRPGMPAALSLYCLHAAMQEVKMARIRYNLFFCGALAFGARADAETPERKDYSFWQVEPYLAGIRETETIPEEAWDLGPLKRLMARHSDAAQAVSHGALLLAAESGAVNYMKAHPDFARFCEWDKAPCGCLPLLYHAAAHPFAYVLMVAKRPGPPSALRTTISMLLSLGADPNMIVKVRASMPEGQQTYLDTPWRGWLRWFGDFGDPEDRAAAADITAMFLAAGADPTQDVAGWILPYLSDPRNRDTLTVSEAQLSSAVGVLRGQVSGAAQEPKQEDGRPWLQEVIRGEVYFLGDGNDGPAPRLATK
ncbi:hypothetical protein B0I37DRAFT_323904 [Chaetomium sp. MPI-CAGE-AT-0009]|nr:hypothetical protein B0I37DRAFT_323904 [Chaetomium sp. MPI-CAGE-AT-0009]